MDNREPLSLLRAMLLIRAFEEALVARPDHGFQLLSSGEEAVAVGLCAAMTGKDQLLCSGRSIGPSLARGLAPGAVMSELLGKATGPNLGRGGRGHIAQPSIGFFGAHAVVAGNLSIAAGVALALQAANEQGVVACMFGDGACGSGALHETLNIAALWKLPLVLVCDNNQLSIATPRTKALAPARLADLAKPFGIPGVAVDGMDVLAVQDAARVLIERARAGEGPALLECESERFSSHSTATRETRSPDTMAKIVARCPIERFIRRLREDALLDETRLATMRSEVEAEIVRAMTLADAAPFPDPSEAFSDV